MKNIFNEYNKKNSFFKVLTWMNALILIISFTLVGVVATFYFQKNAKDHFTEHSQMLLKQDQILIEYISDTVVNLSRQVFRSQKFNNLIASDYSNLSTRALARNEAAKILEPQLQAFEYIESIVFIGENGFNVAAPNNLFLDIPEENLNDFRLRDLAWSRKTEYVWIPPSTHEVYAPNKPVITVIKSFQNFVTLENSGILVINLDPEIFKKATTAQSITNGGIMFLADSTGELITLPDNKTFTIPEGLISHVTLETISHDNQNGTAIADPKSFETSYGDVKYLVSYTRLENTNWYAVLTLEKATLSEGTERVIQFMILIIILALVISMSVTLKLLHWLFQPLISLSEVMNSYASGNYDVRVHETYRYEFETLRKNFNKMADRISRNFNRIHKQMETIQEYSSNLERSRQELNTFNQELELRVEHRTKELIETNSYLEEALAHNEETQAELLIAQNNLENSLEELKQTQSQLIETEKNAALGQLLSGISHEINTPLGTAFTTITYLGNTQKDISALYNSGKMGKKEFESFLSDATEMTSLITQTLQKTINILSRFKEISTLQSENDMTVYSLYEKIQDITSVYKERNKTVSYKVDIPENLVLKAPRGLLQELFEILMENSLLHGFSEGTTAEPEISIRAEVKNKQLVITYGDNGIGLQAHQLDHIFEPFYTTKYGSGGNGLGLHLLYNIVATALQGTVDVSTEGEYALEFKITLPSIVLNSQ